MLVNKTKKKSVLINLLALVVLTGYASQTVLAQDQPAISNPTEEPSSATTPSETPSVEASESQSSPVDKAAILNDNGRYEEALAIIEPYVEEHPKDADGYRVLGIVQRNMKHYQKAVEAFEQAEKIGFLDPEMQANLLINYGIALQMQARYSDAAKKYEAAIAINPRDFYKARLFDVKKELEKFDPKYVASVLPPKKTCAIDFISQNINYTSVGALIDAARQSQKEGCTELVLNIATDGGNTVFAVAASNFLRNLDMTIITNNLSMTASSGLYLYCVGTIRYSDKNAFFMLHDLGFSFNEKSMMNVTNNMHTLAEQAFSTLKGCVPEEILSESRDGGRREYYWTKEQAAKIGVVTNTEQLKYKPEHYEVVSK